VSIAANVAKSKRKDDEPLLKENPHRYTMFPVQYPEVWDMYKKAQASIWFAEEVDLSEDDRDWAALNDDERHFILHVLAFFAASDGIVGENLAQCFYDEVQIPEARAFYATQIAVETTHSEVYSQLIEKYVSDEAKRMELFHAVTHVPAIAAKAKWALQWMDRKHQDFATRLLCFAAVEGIFFSGSFCAIFWLKKRGIMPGLTLSNEWISRDEGLHVDFAVLLFSMLKHKPSAKKAKAIIKEAVDAEKEFICDALKVSLIGMNSDEMSQYIEYIADRLLLQLGYSQLYGTKNPFPWMLALGLHRKTNFFESRVTNYARARVGKSPEDLRLAFDADF
jgi:ribonucleoside-diphosphate reductase subunit M2